MSLSFNQTCLNERLLLKYIYFETYDPAAQHDTDTQKYRQGLVKRQINCNKEKINTLNTEAHNVHNKLKNSLSTRLLQAIEHKLSYVIEKIFIQPLMIAYERSESTRTILVNLSTNSNLKPRHLSGNLKGS